MSTTPTTNFAPLLLLFGCVRAANFRPDGSFTILQVADMHINNGARTACRDVADDAYLCTDLNTTDFVRRAIQSVKPDLVVFTGDNVECSFGTEPCADLTASLKLAFSPAIEAAVPWVATLGNHDALGSPQGQRAAVMQELAKLPGFAAALAQRALYNGAGTFALHVDAPRGSTGGITLLVLDSGGDLSLSDYDCLHNDQLNWLEAAAADARLRAADKPSQAAICFFHIPLPEYAELLREGVNISGVNQQSIGYSLHDGGAAFAAIERARNIKAVFVGHDHVNDYCGLFRGVQLCYGGGAGYHAYGLPNWQRRVRVVRAREFGRRIESWKVLDERYAPIAPSQATASKARKRLTPIDCEVLWAADGPGERADDCARMPRARRHPPAPELARGVAGSYPPWSERSASALRALSK